MLEQASKPSTKAAKSNSLWLLMVLTILSLLFWKAPVVGWLIAPVNTFVTTLHELGHAIFCLATGGSVVGLTIVSDNQGHGGLTMCRGGMPLIYTQTGYLGTALFGCLFIYLGRFPRLAKISLLFFGAVIVIASIVLMSGSIFHEGRILQGVASMAWGLAIGAALIWSGLKLPTTIARLLLLFLAVQTALNALTDVSGLIFDSMGMRTFSTFSDATNMADMTHIPAFLWSLIWGAVSLMMLGVTVWFTYLRKPGVPR